MAPTKAQKRGPQETKAAAGKKARAEKDPLTLALEAVINDADLPQTCRDMLLVAVTPSLNTRGEPRHQIQELVINMIEELIAASENQKRGIVDEAAKVESSCQAAKAELSDKLAAANAALADKAQIVDDKNSALAAIGENVDKAAAALEEQKELQRTGDAKMVETQGVKDSVIKGIDVDYKAIMEASGSCDELLPVLKKLGADESLVQALPSTCAKAPADRGPFDAMVLDQLVQFLKTQLAELSKVGDGEAAGVAERAAAVASADKHLADVKNEQVQATEAHASATKEMQEASAAVSSVKAEVKAHEQVVRAATKAHTGAVAELQAFQQSTREPFDAFRSASKTDAPEPAAGAEAKSMEVEPQSEAAEAAVTVGGA